MRPRRNRKSLGRHNELSDRNVTITVHMKGHLAVTMGAVLFLVFLVRIVLACDLSIQTVLADPQPHHMKVVTLTGTSHQVQALRDAPNARPNFDFQCYLVHPPYTFVLADDTGVLQVTVRGRPPCVSQNSPAEPPDVSEGNKLQVEVQIRVAPVYRDGVTIQTVEAQAVGIRRLDD
jgi:hypothetical protein